MNLIFISTRPMNLFLVKQFELTNIFTRWCHTPPCFYQLSEISAIIRRQVFAFNESECQRQTYQSFWIHWMKCTHTNTHKNYIFPSHLASFVCSIDWSFRELCPRQKKKLFEKILLIFFLKKGTYFFSLTVHNSILVSIFSCPFFI